MWKREIIRGGISLAISVEQPPIIWCDNIGASSLASNPVFHARTKHIEIDAHFVRERIAAKELEVRYVSTDLQIADVFTKALSISRFCFLRDKLNLNTPQLSLREHVKESANED